MVNVSLRCKLNILGGTMKMMFVLMLCVIASPLVLFAAGTKDAKATGPIELTIWTRRCESKSD